MSFEDGIEKEALDRGVGVLKLGGNAVEINEETVKAWKPDVESAAGLSGI
jgi:hypothetical protein